MRAFRSIVLAAGLLASASLAVAAEFTFDAAKYHEYLNEFDTYVTGNWTLTTTEAGAGDATEALTNIDGGALLITNDAGANDADYFQKVGESFKFETGKRLYCAARLKVSDATQSVVLWGLQITDDTPLDVTDGIFFMKDDGDALLDFYVEKDNTATSATAVATLVADTFVTLAFYYDGSTAAIKYLVDGVELGSSALTNVPNDEELTISFGLKNGEAVAKTMTVDYVFCSKSRT